MKMIYLQEYQIGKHCGANKMNQRKQWR